MAQETPVVTRLSSAHANTSPTYPLTLFGQAVAVRGDLAMVGVPEFETVDANGNPVSGGIVEMYEGNASGTQWTRTGSFLPPYPDTDGSFGVPRQPSRDQATLSTTARYTCPLCEEQANHDVWYTQDQLLYQQQVVDFYMQDAVNDALEQEFRGVQGHHVHAGQERRSRPDRAPRAE